MANIRLIRARNPSRAHVRSLRSPFSDRLLAWPGVIALVASCIASSAYAIEGFGLSLGNLSGPDWRAEGIDLSLDWQAGSQAGFSLTVRKLRLSGLPRPLENILVECSRGRVDGGYLACADARVRVDGSELDRPVFRAAFQWDFLDRRLSLDLSELRLARGKLRVKFASNPSGWHLDMRGYRLDIGRLRVLTATHASLPKGWETSGWLSPRVQIRGSGEKLLRISWNLPYQAIGFSDPQAEYMAEGLGGQVSGHTRYRRGRWEGEMSLQLAQGEILMPQAYLSAAEAPIEVNSDFRFDPAQRTLEIDSLDYHQKGTLNAKVSAEFDLAGGFDLQHLILEVGRTSLQSVYGNYLQPVLAESLFEDLAWQGQAELMLNYRPAAASDLVVELHEVHVDSAVEGSQATGQPRPFGLYGINGRLVWTRGGTPEASTFSWQGGHILDKLTLGPARLALSLSHQEMRMLRPAEIPLLDGQLLVDHFLIALSPDEGEQLEFDGILTPVSLQNLSRAFGWPELAGKLSGVIPDVSYREGRLQVAGNLLVRAFEGDIVIRHLRVQDLFGVFPILNAELELRDLDLEILTRTFSFGKITGKLGGVIEGLQLEDWTPVAFNARFATPEDDDSRHRISQKAVDNISALGGAGISGAFSRGFLSFFESFGYKRLGISCRLADGVCEMDGVSPADNGYHLVEGGGIPRISIIGYNQRTDWQSLLDQLRSINATSSPIVE